MSAAGIRVVPVDGPGGSSTGTDDAAPGSVLGQLRAAAARQREEQLLELPVGGAFGRHLVIVYGVLPPDELQRYTQIAQRTGEVALAIDMAVASCKRVLWRENGDTDLNVGLDARLWALLEWPLPEGVADVSELTASEVVYGLFGNNGLAMGAHLERLSTWMQDPGGDDVGEASPES